MNNENNDHRQGFCQLSLTEFFLLFGWRFRSGGVLHPALMFSVLMIQMHSSFRHSLYRTMGEAWALLWYFSQGYRKLFWRLSPQSLWRGSVFYSGNILRISVEQGQFPQPLATVRGCRVQNSYSFLFLHDQLLLHTDTEQLALYCLASTICATTF